MKIVILFSLLLFPVGTFAGNHADNQIPMMDFQQFEHRLYHDNDTIYLVNFWATWCAPCIREIPYFEKINELYGHRKVKVLLVSLDFPNQIDSRLIPFIEKNNVRSEVILLDDPYANSWIPKVSEAWSGAIPATVIYQGDKRQFYEKEFKYEELEAIVQSFLD